MPGVRGPAQTPTTPLEAIEPLSASCSNQSSSRSPTDIVKIADQVVDVALGEPGGAARLAQQRQRGRAGCCEPSAGGSRSIIGRRNAAVRSSRSSKSA